ncbi:MAG: response regulator [Candidatus Omnitrophica bacterium]|nr:response regulator [Candidatus Omnitrophota bacterium]MDE2010442.1 response regulator [Candidatus Omnitrophota bacterium]MDE2215359.1 response regulator [Candidatus Omnitrophota bacterium]MDE2232315.1 response regulator [Candidatus Omnitrophota bacterium]
MLSKVFSIFKPRAQQKHIKVLIIEDTEVDMRLACSAVEKGGYTALKAYDGKSGFERALAEKPHMIILDYMLPDIKGPDVCKLLKAHLDTSTIPVLFLTSMTDPDYVVNCFEQEGDYLSKPISVNLLLKHIDAILKEHVSP